MGYNYSRKFEKEDSIAKAVGMDLPVSTKHCIEICNWIRNKRLEHAISMLEDVVKEKRNLPFKRFNKGVGHKREGMAGRYPKKACTEVMKVLKLVGTNAQFKGLNTPSLEIIHVCAHKAATPPHYGRFFGRVTKRTHVEVVVEEKEKAPKEKKTEVKAKKKEKTEKKPAEEVKTKKKEEKPKEKKEIKPEEEKPKEKVEKKLSSESEKGLEKSKTSQKEEIKK